MNDLKIFNYSGKQVRTLLKNNQPWWVLKDVCDILGLTNPSVVADRLDDDERSKFDLGRQGEATIINESGLYNVILRSDKPEAKPFRKWVTGEVLPMIRKHGAYMTPDTIEKAITNPDFIIQLATKLKEHQAEIAAQNRYIKALEPKADFFDAVADSKTAIEIGEAAKVLNMGIGRNTLFEFLRKNCILMNNNQPYQQYIDRGYFRLIEQKYTKPDGTTHINIKTLVYQRGLDHIRKLLNRSLVKA